MADQRKITLRATHATPKNIILRELPVATPSAGTRIYLYPFHATAKNIILRNPLVADAPAVAPEDFILGNSDPDLGFMEIDSGEESEALSFTFGPLPADVIAAVDLLVNTFDDAETPDEFDYSFSFTLLEDAKVYAGQFEEAPEPDEPDHSFTFTLLEDAQIYALVFDDALGSDEIDYDFSASIQDDVVIVADEPPYQHFDDYDENFESDEYSFYLGNVADGIAPDDVQPVTGGGGHWHGRFRPPEEEEPEKPQLEIVKIGEGTPHEVVTGLVVPKIKARDTRLAHLEALSSGQFDAAKLRSEQKRRLLLADDEWFMMN